ncbi:MAG: transglutaminase TgpA family protein [Candidatus Limnocylindrales bacterium]
MNQPPPIRPAPPPVRPAPRRLPLAPAEGWATIFLIAVLAVAVGTSIADARWVLGRGDLTGFLPLAALGGVGWGILGAKVGWGRWTTHVLGAVVAALVVPLLVGPLVDPGVSGLSAAYVATASSTVQAFLDLTVRSRTVTQEYGHFLLVLGLVVWGTGQFAGYAALGHRRPLGAIFVTGLVLLVNVAIPNDPAGHQFWILVAFSTAALLLLVRLHAEDMRAGWLRRRIGDPRQVSNLYLRGGTVFVVVAVGGSLLLTSTAASAPLGGAFAGVDDRLVEVGQAFQRYLPFGGPGTRLSGVSFGPTASITGLWVTDPTPALEITVPAGDTTPYYWGAYAYDQFIENGWSISTNTRIGRAAGSPILAGTGDAIEAPSLRHTLAFSVRNLDFTGTQIFTPDAPATVDVSTDLTVIGSGRYFAGLEATGSWTSYRATALVPTASVTGFTANKLRAASTAYPAEIASIYRDVPTGAIGPSAQRLLAQIRAKAIQLNGQAVGGDPSNWTVDPYDLAAAAVAVLRSNQFTYSTDVTDLASACSQLSTVECFAEYRRGYCQYYATTMAILLRAAGVPTRFVQGWLPGVRDPTTGEETILRSNSHAWVEVYFPGYGWIPFDPTGNGQTQPAVLPAGPVVPPAPAATPAPVASGGRGPDRTPNHGEGAGSTSGSNPAAPPSSAPFIVVAVMLLIVVGGLAAAAYRRGPRGPIQPESAWARIVRLAGRFGWAPRPTQTPFEYATALGEVLPVARPDLQLVAHAKVEVAYGRRTLDDARLARVRAAERRLRIVLLRLLLRRPRPRPK